MATSVNMCTLGATSSYVRYVINQQVRPLLTNAHHRRIATREFYTRYCRTVRAESSARNIVRHSHFSSRQIRVLYGYPYMQHLEHVKFMSTGQKPSITEDILKSKLDETVKAAGSDPNDKEPRKSADTSNSWFGGKHAWKLGLLSLAAMGILMSGNLLIVWGKLKTDASFAIFDRGWVICDMRNVKVRMGNLQNRLGQISH